MNYQRITSHISNTILITWLILITIATCLPRIFLSFFRSFFLLLFSSFFYIYHYLADVDLFLLLSPLLDLDLSYLCTCVIITAIIITPQVIAAMAVSMLTHQKKDWTKLLHLIQLSQQEKSMSTINKQTNKQTNNQTDRN